VAGLIFSWRLVSFPSFLARSSTGFLLNLRHWTALRLPIYTYNFEPFSDDMGKLIKNQWARLIALTAGACTPPHACPRDRIDRIDLSWAAFWGFFFPKAFFDMFTPYTPPPKSPSSFNSVFNVLVAPVPVVQLINLLAGFAVLSLEWPLPWLKGTPVYRAFALRFAAYPIIALFALLQYQATNAAFYLLIATAYFLPYLLAMGANGKDLCPGLV